MKKLLMIAAMVTMVLAVSVPAIAKIDNSTAQSDETGNVTLSFSVQQSGNNSDQCVTPQQFANTGSDQNGQGVLQYTSTSAKINPEGGTFTFAPSETAPCTQQVQQSSAANG